MADKELKPCPFCGSEAHLDRHDIFCDCGAKIDIPTYVGGKVSVGGLPTYEEARKEMIEAWNDRTPTADVVPRSEVEKAKQEVAREIFEEIEKSCRTFGAYGIHGYIMDDIAELKKKYIGE